MKNEKTMRWKPFFDFFKRKNTRPFEPSLATLFLCISTPIWTAMAVWVVFLMNAMLASGGYPWTIIHVAHRDEYMSSLEKASVEKDILPFVTFVTTEMQVSG